MNKLITEDLVAYLCPLSWSCIVSAPKAQSATLETLEFIFAPFSCSGEEVRVGCLLDPGLSHREHLLLALHVQLSAAVQQVGKTYIVRDGSKW